MAGVDRLVKSVTYYLAVAETTEESTLDDATANFTAHFYDVPSKIHVTHEVERTGVELVMLYVCPGDDAGGSMSPVRFDGSIAFRNPYGYLAAATFGFLPYFAALAALGMRSHLREQETVVPYAPVRAGRATVRVQKNE